MDNSFVKDAQRLQMLVLDRSDLYGAMWERVRYAREGPRCSADRRRQGGAVLVIGIPRPPAPIGFGRPPPDYAL